MTAYARTLPVESETAGTAKAANESGRHAPSGGTKAWDASFGKTTRIRSAIECSVVNGMQGMQCYLCDWRRKRSEALAVVGGKQ